MLKVLTDKFIQKILILVFLQVSFNLVLSLSPLRGKVN